VSRVLRALEDTGFVTIKKIGLSRIVAISETKHASLWRKLALEFGHMSLEELLSGTSLQVLSAICSLTLSNRREIAQAASVSER
jgi:glucokinase